MSEDSNSTNDVEASEISDDRLSDIFDRALTSYNQLQAKRQISNDAELEVTSHFNYSGAIDFDLFHHI